MPLSPSASVRRGVVVGSSGLGLGSAAGGAEGARSVAWVVERSRGSSVVNVTATDVGLIPISGTEEERITTKNEIREEEESNLTQSLHHTVL